jgi:hypothetical protein
MSILTTLFGGMGGGQPQNPALAQKTPGNFPATPTSAPTPGNATVPTVITEPKPPETPMAQFADLWKDVPVPAAPTPVIGNIDPAAIQAAAAKNDFMKVVTEEQKAAITKGGPEAINAFMSVMQGMSQKSFGDSAQATAAMIKSALETQKTQIFAELPNLLKQNQVSENLRSSNPMFANPAVAPILEMMKNQVMAKHPNMPAAEQVKMAQDYVLSFADQLGKKSPAPAGTNTTDWDLFLQ